eukprot:g1318.t1
MRHPGSKQFDYELLKWRAKILHKVFPGSEPLRLVLYEACGWYTGTGSFKESYHLVWPEILVDKETAIAARTGMISDDLTPERSRMLDNKFKQENRKVLPVAELVFHFEESQELPSVQVVAHAEGKSHAEWAQARHGTPRAKPAREVVLPHQSAPLPAATSKEERHAKRLWRRKRMAKEDKIEKGEKEEAAGAVAAGAVTAGAAGPAGTMKTKAPGAAAHHRAAVGSPSMAPLQSLPT